MERGSGIGDPGAQRLNLRAYVAGTGASGGLVGGTVLIMVALAAFVAFKGLPLGGSGGSEGRVLISQARLASGPRAAALALGGAPRAVAAVPVGAPAAGAPAVGGGAPAGSGPPGLTQPPTGGSNPSPPGGTGITPVPPGGDGGPTTHIIHEIPGCGLCDVTDPITNTVDDALTNALNGAGSAIGRPHLGDNTVRTVNGLTDTLLGRCGVVNGLVHRGSCH